MAFRVPIYDCFGLSGEDFFTEQQYFKVKPGQLETLTFTYSQKYVGQIQYKVEINKIISEAQSGCHRYQAVSVEKGRTILSVCIGARALVKYKTILDYKNELAMKNCVSFSDFFVGFGERKKAATGFFIHKVRFFSGLGGNTVLCRESKIRI